MEAFPVGSHVVIELMDERKIAGYILSVQEDGLLLRVTHKDAVLTRHISEKAKADIAAQLSEKSWVWLRTSMLVRRNFGGLFGSREAVEAELAFDIETDLLEQSDDGVQFRALSSPVLTFVSAGAVMLIESTDDKQTESEISLFDQTLDAALEKILTLGEDDDTTKDEDGSEELAGRDGETETGDRT